MGALQLESITAPNNFRTGINLSGTDIPSKRILKMGATRNEVALASTVSDAFVGVSDEIIYNGKSQSYQRGGRTILTSGGAVAIGDTITSDGNGKGITATQSPGATQRVIGYACTATTGTDQDFECDLGGFGTLASGILSFADRAAIKAVVATNRFDGMMAMARTDGSLWRFIAAAAQAADAAAGSEQFILVPGAGTGRWVRSNGSFVAALPFAFGTADATALCTIPEGFVARLAGFPWWEIAVDMTGGASAAIGMSTAKTGYNTKGDLLGGATGDVLANLTAGVKVGTNGAKLDTIAHLQALILVEGDILRFDAITSAFTAGNGVVRVPLIITGNDSPLTP